MSRLTSGLFLTMAATVCGAGRARAAEGAAAASAPCQTPPAAPAVERHGLMLEARMGVSYVQAGWESSSADIFPSAAGGIGPEARLRMGGLLRPRLALLADAAASAPLLPGGVAMAGVGVAARWFAGPSGAFHVDAGLRRAWGYRYGVSMASLPIREIWLAEIGVGSVARAGQVDRGWTVSLFGGVVPKAVGHGHAAGVSLTHGWSWL
jgi:hypothetical protein